MLVPRDDTSVIEFMIANSIPHRDRPEYTNRWIAAAVPVSQIIPLSNLPAVIYIGYSTPPDPASSNIEQDSSQYDAKRGLIHSEPNDGNNPASNPVETANGAIWHGASNWHPTQDSTPVGYDGSGIKIGIIDNGFSNIGTVLDDFGLTEDDIESRCYAEISLDDELTIERVDFDSLDYCIRQIPAGNHGSNVLGALLEIAPAATIHIANLPDIKDFHKVAKWLYEDKNVDVINSSFGILWEGPGDGTSWHIKENPTDLTEGALNAVNDAVENATVWIAAAGNSSDKHIYSGPFLQQSGSRKMLFRNQSTGVDTDFNTLTTTSSHKIMIRWEDDDNDETNLNLFRCPTSTCENGIVTESQRITTISDHPIEMIEVEDAIRTSYLKVCVETDTVPDWVQLGIFNDADAQLSISTKFQSIVNPAESVNSGLITVGAVAASGTTIEPTYTLHTGSGRGPTTGGQNKPDVVGIHGETSYTAHVSDLGTSFASPRIAGLAALVIQQMRQQKLVTATGTPTVLPTEVVGFLKMHAVKQPAEPGDPHFSPTPHTTPTVNNSWGWGFAKLPTLTPTPGATPTPTPSPTASPSPTSTPTPTATATATSTPTATATATPSPTPTSTPSPTPTPTTVPVTGTLSLSRSTIYEAEAFDITATVDPDATEFLLETTPNLRSSQCFSGPAGTINGTTSAMSWPATVTFHACPSGQATVWLRHSSDNALITSKTFNIATRPDLSADLSVGSVTFAENETLRIQVGNTFTVTAANADPEHTFRQVPHHRAAWPRGMCISR